MTYLTDRHRVEFALLPALMFGIMTEGVNDPDLPEAADTFERLRRAANAPMAGLHPLDEAKIARRVERIRKAIVAPYNEERVSTAKAGLMVVYLLKLITESDYLVIEEGSDLDAALRVFIPAVEHAYMVDALDRSAQKQARRMLRELQVRHGLFRDVEAAEAA
jgi:hypothetical protein